MDVSVVMNMDASPNSLKDACMVESITSPRGDDKRHWCIGGNMSYVNAMGQYNIERTIAIGNI